MNKHLVSISELHSEVQKKKKIRKETYVKILDIISKRIKTKNELGEKRMIFSTPSYVMGCPSFDVYSATIYLERQLKNGGYNTRLISNDSIYIDWYPKRNKKKEPSTERVTERDVLEDEFSNLINLKKFADKYSKN